MSKRVFFLFLSDLLPSACTLFYCSSWFVRFCVVCAYFSYDYYYDCTCSSAPFCEGSHTHTYLTAAAPEVAIAGLASWSTIALIDPAFPRPEPVSECASEVGEFIRVGLFACFRLWCHLLLFWERLLPGVLRRVGRFFEGLLSAGHPGEETWERSLRRHEMQQYLTRLAEEMLEFYQWKGF